MVWQCYELIQSITRGDRCPLGSALLSTHSSNPTEIDVFQLLIHGCTISKIPASDVATFSFGEPSPCVKRGNKKKNIYLSSDSIVRLVCSYAGLFFFLYTSIFIELLGQRTEECRSASWRSEFWSDGYRFLTVSTQLKWMMRHVATTFIPYRDVCPRELRRRWPPTSQALTPASPYTFRFIKKKKGYYYLWSLHDAEVFFIFKRCTESVIYI